MQAMALKRLHHPDPALHSSFLEAIRRAELLETSKILDTAALDPYDFLRDAYLQRLKLRVEIGG